MVTWLAPWADNAWFTAAKIWVAVLEGTTIERNDIRNKGCESDSLRLFIGKPTVH
jgi:hypothetical protein